jgi:aryl sulfotransferase
MPNQNGIFWLASYPKSGNTWFRIFLAHLLNPLDTSFDLNTINTGAIASSRDWIDYALGFDSADLSHDELNKLRPAVYQWYGELSEDVSYHKIHDAYTWLESSPANKIPLIPNEGCLGALYFIRNPFDVAISFANHSSCSIDQAIEYMGNKQHAFCKGKYKQYNQLRQSLLSWSMHVESWVGATAINKLVIRYEDMKLNPMETFTKAAEFLNISVVGERIAEALDNTSIDKLQALEEQFGFREKPHKVKRFFRKGIVDDWQNTLSVTQIEKIIADHSSTMRKYGYLDENNKPVILQKSGENQ